MDLKSGESVTEAVEALDRSFLAGRPVRVSKQLTLGARRPADGGRAGAGGGKGGGQTDGNVAASVGAAVGVPMSALERLQSMLEQIIAVPAKAEMAMLLETHQLVGAQSMAADVDAAQRGPGEGRGEAGERERGGRGGEGAAGLSLAARFPPICQGMQGFPRDADVDRVLAANQVSARTTCQLMGARIDRRSFVSIGTHTRRSYRKALIHGTRVHRRACPEGLTPTHRRSCP